MFLAGVGIALVFQGAESGDDASAGFGGLDDGVNVAALGRDKGIGETVAELRDLFLAFSTANREAATP